jgi:hypothetical protein
MPAGRFASSPGAIMACRDHRLTPPSSNARTNGGKPGRDRLMSMGSCQGAYLDGPSMAFDLNRSTGAFGPPAGGWKAADSR